MFFVRIVLQLHLGLQLVVAVFTWGSGANAKIKERLASFQWQAFLQAAMSAAGPGALLSAFGLIQIHGKSVSSFTLAAFVTVGASLLVSSFLSILVPLCGFDVPEVDVATGDAVPESSSLRKLTKCIAVVKCIGYCVLLFASVPEGVALICASALVRVGFASQAIFSVLYVVGEEDGNVANACADSAHILHGSALLAGLALFAELATHESSSMYTNSISQSIVFQVFLICCVVGIFAKVSLVAVLHLACGGGVLDGSGAHQRISSIHWIFNTLLTVGMFGCVACLSWDSVEIDIFHRFSGFEVKWGPPYQAIALMIAAMASFTQLLECVAPERPPVTDGQTNSKFQAGISEPMKAITSRGSFLVLALVVLQLAPAPKKYIDEEDSIFTSLAGLSAAFFLPCVGAMVVQILMLLTFVFVNSDETTEPAVDCMGTLEVASENKGGQAMVQNLRGVASILMIMGLALGVFSMGVLPWILIKLVGFVVVFPLLPQTGKDNLKDLVSIKLLIIKACCSSVIGEVIEAWFEKMRARDNAAAEKRAAEMLDTEETKNRTKTKSDATDFKKKQMKTAVGGGKKKKM